MTFSVIRLVPGGGEPEVVSQHSSRKKAIELWKRYKAAHPNHRVRNDSTGEYTGRPNTLLG